jgi:prevent-host-death family protein
MTDTVNMHEAKTHLSRLVERVEGGEEVIIARAGRLVPYRAHREPRQPGLLKGEIWLADDWDSPDVNAEIAALFEG